MPDKDGKLSLAERQIVFDWLKDKTREKTLFCQVCGSNAWVLEDYAVAPPILRQGLVLGGDVYPYVLVVCSKCGYTLYFNGVAIGLYPHSPKKEEKSGGE